VDRAEQRLTGQSASLAGAVDEIGMAPGTDVGDISPDESPPSPSPIPNV
jgi:hypothetical protein